MSARSRKLGVPFSHERGDQAVARRNLLDRRLEQRGFVGCSDGLIHGDGSLVDTRAGLGVKAFRSAIESAELIDHLEHQVRIAGRTYTAIPPHPGAEGRSLPK